MKLGIVGSAQETFTPRTERLAREVIRGYITIVQPAYVVSGGCHMGGVDAYAEEEAAALGVPTIIHKPATLSWPGYKARNLLIAKSDAVLCIVPAELPRGFCGGIAFEECYHCQGRNPPHIKSGGCWTAWRCPVRAWEIIR